MFGVLRVAKPGLFKRLPRRSSVQITRCAAGATRYYEIFLRIGRDGEAVRLLYEQITPFMSPRLITPGLSPDGVTSFSAQSFKNAVLLQTALRCAVYMGGIAGIIEPSGEIKTARKFLPYCNEVRLFCAKPFSDPSIDVYNDLSALRGCNIIISFSGFTGLGSPVCGNYKNAAIFTSAGGYFNGGFVIDGVKPRIPNTILPVPQGVDPLVYTAACCELCGMYGLSSITPTHIYSGAKPVSFDEIFNFTKNYTDKDISQNKFC